MSALRFDRARARAISRRPGAILRSLLGSCIALVIVADVRPQRQPVATETGLPPTPLVFVENRGQWRDEIAFRADHGAFTAWFHARGWTMTARTNDGATERGVHARLTFEGARTVRPVGTQRLPSSSSYLRGRDHRRWVTGAAHFSRIRLNGLYDGIDVIVRSQAQRPEYDVVLAPGADLEQVVIRCDGFDDLEVAPDGSLAMRSAHGTVHQTPPTTYHVLPDGRHRLVGCRFRRIDSRRYGFIVDDASADLPLVIDPGFLWSTYVGGNGPDDRVYTVRRAPGGRVVAAGTTDSTDFPTTMGAFSRTPSGSRDAWVAVFEPAALGAMQLVSSTRFGGTGDDWCYNVDLGQRSGVLTLSGNTRSADFPVTADAFQTVHAGDFDGYYLELDLRRHGAAQLRYATLIGGPGRDFVTAHKVHGDRVTMAGEAAAGFPVTPGAFQTAHGGGGADAFVAVLGMGPRTRGVLLASTFLGGSGADGNRLDFVDQGVDLDVDEHGAAVVAGRTASADFPVTPDALQRSLRGLQDGFVTCFDRDLGSVRYSSYVGGDGSDAFSQVHVDGNGIVTAAGYAGGSGFPVTAGAFQTAFAGGNSDIAVVRIDTTRAGLAGLVYGTYLGGGPAAPVTSTERLRGMAVERSGAIVLGGFVGSTGFPTTAGAVASTLGGPPVDAVIARIDPRQPAARQLLYSSYLPGNAVVAGLGLDSDGQGGAFIGGVTSSADYPTTPGAFDSTLSVGLDGFISQLDLLPAGVHRSGHPTPGCGATPYAGITTQPRGPQPDFGLFNVAAPSRAFGAMLLGSPATHPLRLANAAVFVDLNRPMTTVPVRADASGFVQVELSSDQLQPPPVAAQFVWLNGLACRGSGLLSASNALSF